MKGFKKSSGLLKHLQWNLGELGEVEDMIWQFTLSVCLKILTPLLEVKLRSFPRPARPAGGCCMQTVSLDSEYLCPPLIHCKSVRRAPQTLKQEREHAQPHL